LIGLYQNIKKSTTKLDMGKSCIRFKKMDQIPYNLIGELCKKITDEQWIDIYTGKLNLITTQK
jgi:hypothetical protein